MGQKFIFISVFVLTLAGCNKKEAFEYKDSIEPLYKVLEFYPYYHGKMNGPEVLPSDSYDISIGKYPQLTTINNGELTDNFDIEYAIDIIQGKNTNMTFQMVLENIKEPDSPDSLPVSIIISSSPDTANNIMVGATSKGGTFSKMCGDKSTRNGTDSLFKWENMVTIPGISSAFKNVFDNPFYIKLKRRGNLMTVEIYLPDQGYNKVYQKEFEVNNKGEFHFEWLNATPKGSSYSVNFLDDEIRRAFVWKDAKVCFPY